jgi:hypothetical protein
MKRYNVQTVEEIPTDWRGIEAVRVDIFLWRTGYIPFVTAAVVYVKERGFAVHMVCAEQNPRTTCFALGSPVWEDSCMEFFANFAPEEVNSYINMETNSAGTLCCNFGESRKGRNPIAKMPVACPTVETEVADDSWSCDFFLPLETIGFLFGKEDFKRGDTIRANFYKCGDKTETEHYGCWNAVETENPDFHRPEFFGELVIE